MPNRRHRRAFVVVVVVVIIACNLLVVFRLLSLPLHQKKVAKEEKKTRRKIRQKTFHSKLWSFRLRLFSLFFPSHTGVPSAALYPQAAAAAMSYPFYQPIIQPMVKFLATTNSNYCWVMHNSHFHMSPHSRHRHYTPYSLSYTLISRSLIFFLCWAVHGLGCFFVPSRGDKKLFDIFGNLISSLFFLCLSFLPSTSMCSKTFQQFGHQIIKVNELIFYVWEVSVGCCCVVER